MKNRAIRFVLTGFPILMLALAGPAGAWSTDPTVNDPVCLDPGEQHEPAICADGHGGAYVVWRDRRNPDNGLDLYAQRLDEAGNRMWSPADGIVICNYAGDQLEPLVSADGDSGCYIAWWDRRSGGNHGIRAQRLDLDGNERWVHNGVPVLTGVDTDPTDMITIPVGGPEDLGGVAIVWGDNRIFPDDIYWQWVDRDGVYRLSYNGNAICTAEGEQSLPRLAMLGDGGGFVCWVDKRDADNWLIYAQRVAGDPPVPQWTADGIPITDVMVNYDDFDLTSAGDNTAIVAWRTVPTATAQDIMAQRIDQSGNLLWGASGAVVCDEPGDQIVPRAVPDGTGGAIVAWLDSGVKIQRLDGAGTRQWASAGVSLGSSLAADLGLCNSPLGGVVVGWNSGYDIYAQRVDQTGSVLWTPGGQPVSTNDQDQSNMVLCPDGAGGAILAWEDNRNDVNNRDIYAQQIAYTGSLGAVSAVPLPGDGPVVRLRSLPPEPNPFQESTVIAWEQAASADARIEIYDLAGRLVALHREAVLPAGRWGYRFRGRDRQGRLLPTGVYVYRVKAGVEEATGKISLVR